MTQMLESNQTLKTQILQLLRCLPGQAGSVSSPPSLCPTAQRTVLLQSAPHPARYIYITNTITRSKEEATATKTSIRGLNTDTKSGPRILTHHAITLIIIPDTNDPCNN